MKRSEQEREEIEEEAAGDVCKLFGMTEEEGSEESLQEIVFNFGGNQQKLLIRKEKKGDSTYGAVQGSVLWPGASYLSRFLCDNSEGRSIISTALQLQPSSSLNTFVELGSGCGLAGIVLSQIISSSNLQVILSDYDSEVIKLLSNNVKLNSNATKTQLKVSTIDWKEPLPSDIPKGTIPLIIAADVTHNKAIYNHLFSTASSLLCSNGLFLMANGKYRYFQPNVAQAAISQGLDVVFERLIDAEPYFISLFKKQQKDL